MVTLLPLAHGRQTSYTNRTFNSLHFGVFLGIFEGTVDLFCATKVIWTYVHIYAYSGEWVKSSASPLLEEGLVA